MSTNAQPSGLPYLLTYSGGLKIVELILDVAVTVAFILSGIVSRGYLLLGAVILSFVSTIIFASLHISSVVKKSKVPWHWIECIYALIVGILVVICSTVVISQLTKGYIITGVLGYLLAMVYFFDTFDKYQLAITPSLRYAWTTPNMPDLE